MYLLSWDLSDLCLYFPLDLWSNVFFLYIFFHMLILVGETLSRKRCSKSCWTSLKILVFKWFVTTKIRSTHVSCILGVLKIINWQVAIGICFRVMVSKLKNNMHETVIVFSSKLSRNYAFHERFNLLAQTRFWYISHSWLQNLNIKR